MKIHSKSDMLTSAEKISKYYKGDILKAIDGTDFEIPNTEKSKDAFGRVKAKEGESIPRASVSMCYDVNKDVIELSMVDSVKKVATYAGWNGKKDEKGRKFLAAIKQAMMEYDEGPRKAIDRYILSHPEKVCFINARNPEDIQYFVDKYDAVTLYIALAPNVESGQIWYSNEEDTVAAFDAYDYEYTVWNRKIPEEYKEQAKKFMEWLNNSTKE